MKYFAIHYFDLDIFTDENYFKSRGIRILRSLLSQKNCFQKIIYIASNQKYDGYQRGLTSMIYKFFDKKLKRGVQMAVLNETNS